jgi:hypothetical protein
VFDENIVERDRPDVLSDDVQAALDWLDQYSSRQVLFQKQDMRTLQNAIARMSPVELTTWLDDTRQLRTRLDSDEWKFTRAWFSEFLSVQVNYSQSEIDEFRQHMAQLSAEQLMEVLDHFQQEHLHRIRGRIASQQQRQRLLATTRNNFGGSGYASGARFGSDGPGRYFGGGSQAARATLRRQRYSPPSGQGLSLRVAHRYIYRGAFGGRFIYGW